MEEKTLEQRAAEALLQEGHECIIRKNIFYIAPPTLRSQISASAYISTLPELSLDETNISESLLHNFKDCGITARILACLTVDGYLSKIREEKRFKAHFLTRKKAIKTLEKKIMEMSNVEIFTLTREVLNESGMVFFWGVITFLRDTNMLRKTEKETTAHGQH